MFNYSVGAERLYNNTLQNISGSLNNLIDYNLYNRWSEQNTSSRLPALYVDDPVPATNNLEVHKASYLKLSHLRIQYNLPVLWDARYYKGGQVYFAIANLFTITRYPGIDPATVGSATANCTGSANATASNKKLCVLQCVLERFIPVSDVQLFGRCRTLV